MAGTTLCSVALLAGAAVALSRLRRVTVIGASMEPTLREGDRLVVVTGMHPRVGALVAVRDPRAATDRMLVKRVKEIGRDGLDVRGDAASSSTDSRTFGPVPLALVEGTVVWRYGPPGRAGRIPARPAADPK